MRCPWFSLMLRTISLIQEFIQQHSFSFHFLLCQAYADNEVSTRLLQISLFLLLSTASLLFMNSLVLPSHYSSTSLVVFLCFLFPPLVRIALLPVVYCSPSLLHARTMSAFFS